MEQHNHLFDFEGGYVSFKNTHSPPMSFKISTTARRTWKSPTWWKVHKRDLQNRLRELCPEQRGVHYPHSTTAERLDSIPHRLSLTPCSWAPCLKSCQGVFVPKRARSSALPSRVCCGLSAQQSDSLMHQRSDLPLGAEWDQRVQRSQQQVLHFCSRYHQWGFSQSERTSQATEVGQTLFKVVQTIDLIHILKNSFHSCLSKSNQRNAFAFKQLAYLNGHILFSWV